MRNRIVLKLWKWYQYLMAHATFYGLQKTGRKGKHCTSFLNTRILRRILDVKYIFREKHIFVEVKCNMIWVWPTFPFSIKCLHLMSKHKLHRWIITNVLIFHKVSMPKIQFSHQTIFLQITMLMHLVSPSHFN